MLSKTAQDTIDKVVLDPVLNIVHPNVVANLTTQASGSAFQVSSQLLMVCSRSARLSIQEK